ncbi:MAG: DUF6498-containing protein [Propionibacteriaceae bacterium]
MLPVALAVSLNAISVLGVLAFGWPAGNVFILFWVENAVIGAWNVVRILTARGDGKGEREPTVTINGRRTKGSPPVLALFFGVHYGLFCLVHAVFTGFVAYTLGIEATFLFLGLPIVLIMIRYTVEVTSVWFGAGQRDVVSPARAMMQPYPRIIVLHVTVIIAFAVTLSQLGSSAVPELLQPTVAAMGSLAGQDVWLVLLLIGLKTVADVWTTKRATRI